MKRKSLHAQRNAGERRNAGSAGERRRRSGKSPKEGNRLAAAAESSCSSPADETPRSPSDDTHTSPDEESPRSHSSTCHLDSGQQPYPRNMENEIDSLDRRIMGMIAILSTSLNLNEGWYHGSEGIELILGKLNSNTVTTTKEMVEERIEKLERMVKDYHENRRSSLPHDDQRRMLYVFSDVGRQYYESVPQSLLSYGRRAAPDSEELEAPSTKRARSESVDMVMYLSHPEAASKILNSGFSMDDCTSRAQRLFQDHQQDRRILYSALSLLRQDIEIRQSFMTLEESYARGYIEHELKNSGMLPTGEKPTH